MQTQPSPENLKTHTPDTRNEIDSKNLDDQAEREQAEREQVENTSAAARAEIAEAYAAEEVAAVAEQLDESGSDSETPKQETAPKQSQKPSMFENIGSAMEKVGKMLEKVRNSLAKTFGAMSTNALKGLHTLASLIGMKKFAELLHRHIEPSEIRDRMQSKLGIDVEATADDGQILQKLHEKHEAVIAASNGTLKPETFSFTAFVDQKIDDVDPGEQEVLTLGSLLQAKSAEERSARDNAEASREEQQEEAKKQEKVRSTQEALKENPLVQNAAHIFALAKAINRMEPNTIPLDETKLQSDLQGQAGNSGYYESVARSLQSWLSDGGWFTDYSSGNMLGIALDGSTIESEDNHNWRDDPNLIEGFDLIRYPKTSVEKLLRMNAAILANANNTAQMQVPTLQQYITEELGGMLGAEFIETPQQEAATEPSAPPEEESADAA